MEKETAADVLEEVKEPVQETEKPQQEEVPAEEEKVREEPEIVPVKDESAEEELADVMAMPVTIAENFKSEILDMILRMAKIEIRVETDPARFRPVDVPIIEPDIEKLQKAVNWQPEIPLERTIAETLEYWRNRL